MEEKKQKSWFRKRWSDILTVIFIILLLIPQTRTPIMVWVQRTFAFGPSVAGTDERVHNYDWQMKDLDGKTLSFEEAKGEVAFINFWATWCPPCIAEMPYMQNLYDDYGDRVKFYFVTDEDPGRIHNFMQKNDYDLPIQINFSALPEPLEAPALPTTYIVGKNGAIHVKKKGSAKWDSKKVRNLLDDLLKE